MNDNSIPGRINATAESKAQRAWIMRVGGLPWSVIAREVGYHDDAGAIRAVRRYAGTLPQVDREASRTLWRERMELLWSHARKAVVEGQPGALRAAVAVAQRASALDALDLPVVSAIVSPSRQELTAVLDRLIPLSGHQEALEGDVFDGEE